jgi:hypothetical protein
LISLIREHTARMRPPRALWVPFELGRPFGPPGASETQTRVLELALRLLEAPSGPILEDYPDETDGITAEDSAWSCPVQFRPPAVTQGTEPELINALRQEVALLQPWYTRALTARGRTTVGASGMPFGEALDLLITALDPGKPQDVRADSIRLAAEDLKAYYMEAATAQPGAASSRSLLDWFWRETNGGALLRALKRRFIDSEAADLRLLASLLLVPASQE